MLFCCCCYSYTAVGRSGTEIATPRTTGAKKLLLLLTILIHALDLWLRRVGTTGK